MACRYALTLPRNQYRQSFCQTQRLKTLRMCGEEGYGNLLEDGSEVMALFLTMSLGLWLPSPLGYGHLVLSRQA